MDKKSVTRVTLCVTLGYTKNTVKTTLNKEKYRFTVLP